MQPHGLISNTALWLWQTLCSGDNDWAKSGRKIIETRNKRKKGHGHHMHPFRPRLACVECVFTTSRCNGHLRLPAFRVPGRERTGNRSAFTNKPKKKKEKKKGRSEYLCVRPCDLSASCNEGQPCEGRKLELNSHSRAWAGDTHDRHISVSYLSQASKSKMHVQSIQRDIGQAQSDLFWRLKILFICCY